MMTLDEMKLAVCEKLPELIRVAYEKKPKFYFCGRNKLNWPALREINWSTEGLQVCQFAETQLTTLGEMLQYRFWLHALATGQKPFPVYIPGYLKEDLSTCGFLACVGASWEHKLEALCRTWFSERFEPKDHP